MRRLSILLSGKYEPEEIAYLAGKMDLVISSRLHLLILASISHVPIIGISRGTKIDNFLTLFNENSVGDVERIDPIKLKDNCERLLNDKAVFCEVAGGVVEALRERLKKAEKRIELYLK